MFNFIIDYKIDAVNSMGDPELPKFTIDRTRGNDFCIKKKIKTKFQYVKLGVQLSILTLVGANLCKNYLFKF